LEVDIVTDLSAASQALTLVKQLKDLDKALDQAAFKASLLELQEAVFDAKSALLDAKHLILEKETRILELEQSLKVCTSGEQCPACRSGSMKVIDKKPYPVGLAAKNGMQNWTMRCDNDQCGHQDIRIHDPNNLMRK
jgi:hypothetical protein